MNGGGRATEKGQKNKNSSKVSTNKKTKHKYHKEGQEHLRSIMLWGESKCSTVRKEKESQTRILTTSKRRTNQIVLTKRKRRTRTPKAKFPAGSKRNARKKEEKRRRGRTRDNMERGISATRLQRIQKMECRGVGVDLSLNITASIRMEVRNCDKDCSKRYCSLRQLQLNRGSIPM